MSPPGRVAGPKKMTPGAGPGLKACRGGEEEAARSSAVRRGDTAEEPRAEQVDVGAPPRCFRFDLEFGYV